MRKKNLSIIVATLVITLSLIGTAFAQTESYPCETCQMTVGPDALDHIKVTDANGTRHYVECMGCALKLLKTSDTIHIETYCDWYGPEYKITADISQHGETTTEPPESPSVPIALGIVAVVVVIASIVAYKRLKR